MAEGVPRLFGIPLNGPPVPLVNEYSVVLIDRPPRG